MSDDNRETLKEFFARENNSVSQELFFKKKKSPEVVLQDFGAQSRGKYDRNIIKLYKKYFNTNPSEIFKILFNKRMNGTSSEFFVIDMWHPDEHNEYADYYYQKDEKQSILDDVIEVARGMNESKSDLRTAYSFSQGIINNIRPDFEQKFSLPGIYIHAFELLDQCTNKKNRSAVIFQFINRFTDVIKRGQNLMDTLDVAHSTDIKNYYDGLRHLSEFILSNTEYLLGATTVNDTWSKFENSGQTITKIMKFYDLKYVVYERRNKSKYGPLNDFFAKSLEYDFSIFQDDDEYDEEDLKTLFGVKNAQKTTHRQKNNNSLRREEQFRLKRERVSQENRSTETLKEFFARENDETIPILSEEEKRQFISAIAPITRGEQYR